MGEQTFAEESEQLFGLDEQAPEQDARPSLKLLVHFRSVQDRTAFSALVGQPVSASTKAISYPTANLLPSEFFDAASANAVHAEQHSLIDVDSNWRDTWRGMPAYSQQDLTPWQSIEVFFKTQADKQTFARLTQNSVTNETKSIWYPRAENDDVIHLRWKSTRPLNPRYPVYVPTKGRWESAFTIQCMERLRIPYFAVVQPQEERHYAPLVKNGVLLLLPSDLDGLVPTRNWILEHSIAAGAERHWQLDDNIKSFFRYHENRQIHVADGTCMRIAEDFADRYTDVAIAGFQYFMFVPRKHGDFPPYVFNTRVYSNSLINNSIPFRYRDIYNDDTDICLRAMKAGWHTIQYNAFLAWKQPTMIVKGGNTPIYLGAERVAAEWVAHARTCKLCDVDESPVDCKDGRAILEKDGRWRMAESLRRQHPDVTRIVRKWNRWQHSVDYRQFKGRVPTLRPGVVLPEGQDEYGLELVEVGEQERAIASMLNQPRQAPTSSPRQEQPQAAAGPSAFAFLDALVASAPPEPARPLPPAPAEPAPALGEALPGEPSPEPRRLQPESGQGQDLGAGQDPPEPELTREELFAAMDKVFAESLKARGHRLLTKEGKLFVSDASRLTPEDRTAIKARKEHLLKFAEPMPAPTDVMANLPPAAPPEPEKVPALEPAPAIKPAEAGTLFTSSRPGQTLAEFLGGEPPRVSLRDYKPDQPPDLTGIDDVILNFATDGLDWRGGHRPIGLTVGTLDGQMTKFLPFRFVDGNLDEAVVKRWAQEQLKGKRILNARTKFDCHMADVWGIDLEAQGCTFSDIQHTAALLDDHRKVFNLDQLDADYFPNERKMMRVAETIHSGYGAAEAAERELYTARLVGRLRDVMYPEIDKQDLRRVQDLEDSVIPAVVEMERNGSPIDVELLEQMGRGCRDARGKLMMEISDEVGFAFEHTAAGWKRLIEKLGLEVPDAFDEATLNQVDHPLVRKGQKASQYAQLDSKIFKAYPDHITDGVLYYDINQLRGEQGGTVSGRFSIGIVQQVPNHDNHHAAFGVGEVDDCNQFDCNLFPRRVFIPGVGDYLQGDAAQVEFRLLVHYSQNAALLQAYRDDPHMSFHKKMQNMLVAHKPDMLYTHTKSYNFAAQYGARSIKLAVMMGFITEREGEEIRAAKRWNDPRLNLIHEIEAAYKQAHPEAGALLDFASHLAKPKCDSYCRQGDKLHRENRHKGFVRTLLGRRSRFPTAYKTYIGLNRVIQGTGADIMKKKIVELHAVRKITGFIMRITNHDAVLGDSPERKTFEMVNEILNRQSFDLSVPILWECGVGRNWAEAK